MDHFVFVLIIENWIRWRTKIVILFLLSTIALTPCLVHRGSALWIFVRDIITYQLPKKTKTRRRSSHLDTDASDFGLGAVLSQRQDEGEKVIAYASRTLNRAELKYETTRKELLAIVYGLYQHKQFLLGRHIIIRTDHAALTWLRRTAEVMPQLARW